MGNSLPMWPLFSCEILTEVSVHTITYLALVVPFTRKPMVRRPRPISNGLHQAMLDRIVVRVIDVPLQILFITDLMLPETAMP
jgi:hypothetical protein